jgi:hypothetical protein
MIDTAIDATLDEIDDDALTASCTRITDPDDGSSGAPAILADTDMRDPVSNGHRLIDLTGQRFGHLIAIARFGTNNNGDATWLCRCDCGVEKEISGHGLRDGRTKSCGCRRLDGTIRHGLYKSVEYRIWGAMLQRCKNPNAGHYDLYGGRGITVDPRWESFENFLADMGNRPSPKHSIERVDNDGPYSPTNCIWATRAIQSRNTRRTLRLTLNGETLCLKDWAQRFGLEYETLRGRIKKGWGIETALTTPPGSKPLKTHCLRGHLLSGDNVYIDPTGKRNCRPCARLFRENNRERILAGKRASYMRNRNAILARQRLTYQQRGQTLQLA